MLQYIVSLLNDHYITLFGCIPLSSCRIQKTYLLEKAGIASGSVIVFAIPYYTRTCEQNRNLSAYAVARDYHLFVQNLEKELVRKLKNKYPHYKFAFFADHSPTDERDAAARAGLGIMGKNGLLITQSFSSYVFLGELITDAVLPYREYEIKECENCGACSAACPYKRGETEICLSALTQKKGALTAGEAALLCRYHTVWGCDICGEVCPHTATAISSGSIYSPIPFFEQDAMPTLTTVQLSKMNEKDFASRAYSWRGRETIKRNVSVMEATYESGDTNSQKTTGKGKKEE